VKRANVENPPVVGKKQLHKERFTNVDEDEEDVPVKVSTRIIDKNI